MTSKTETPVYMKFDNLWSFHNSQKIDKVVKRLQELKMQGQYYNEINMPEIEKIMKGLMNDIEILKKDKVLLSNLLNEKSKPGPKKKN